MDTKTMRCVVIAVLIIVWAAWPALAMAQGSISTISFQGELADGDGSPLSGAYHMRFAIFDGGGDRVWPTASAYEQHDAVGVAAGLFNVLLGGRGHPLNAVHFGGGDRYLQVWVCQTAGADCVDYEPLDPRQPIPSSAYALVAQTLAPGARISADHGDALVVTNSSESDGASAGAFLADGVVGKTSAVYAENASQADGAAAGYFLAAGGDEPQGEYGATYGVHAEAHSSMGTGVYGRAEAALGTGMYGDGGRYGVYGRSSSGYGVYSEGNAHVQGNLTVAGAVHSTQGGFTFPDGSVLTSAAALPAGVIVMWSGSLANLPAGWALCNGANGTPDLRERFVLGTTIDAEVLSTGGARSHTHTTEPHSHLIDSPPDFFTSGWVGDNSLGGGIPIKYYAAVETEVYSPDHRHRVSLPVMESERESVTVSGENHMPPYLRLAFIMKCGPSLADCPNP